MITGEMRSQVSRSMTDDQLLDVLREAADRLPLGVALSKARFDDMGMSVTSSALHRRFGGWNAAMKAAGLSPGVHGRRYTDADCFDALYVAWSRLGRPPKFREMRPPLSSITGKAFVGRWGSWIGALEAFLDAMNTDNPSDILPDVVGSGNERKEAPTAVDVAGSVPRRREVPVSTKWKVGQRDRWRCVKCGRSPATELSVVLHIDHVVPVALGGPNTLENLQMLCSDCNLGKGAASES